jgi:hypothetical protein
LLLGQYQPCLQEYLESLTLDLLVAAEEAVALTIQVGVEQELAVTERHHQAHRQLEVVVELVLCQNLA